MGALTSDDAEYLQTYLGLVEDFVSGKTQLEVAEAALNTLNAAREATTTPSIIRKTIIADQLADYDGWAHSEVC